MKIQKSRIVLIFLALTSLVFTSCAGMVMNMVADSFSGPGGSTTFTGEDDPQLVGDALPFAIKMYDSILDQVPQHAAMHLTTGSIYIMYTNVYVHGPASTLPPELQDEKERGLARATKLYNRGRNLVMKGLELRHPGFIKAFETGDIPKMLQGLTKDDVPYLYWIAAGWMAPFSLNGMDINYSVGVPKVYQLMLKAEELDPQYASVVDLLMTYYSSMPAGMGGDDKKAREYFEKSVKLSGGKSPGPYVGWATSISVRSQNKAEFTEYLNKALALDPNAQISTRLATIVTQNQARWYLEHADNFFIED